MHINKNQDIEVDTSTNFDFKGIGPVCFVQFYEQFETKHYQKPNIKTFICNMKGCKF